MIIISYNSQRWLIGCARCKLKVNGSIVWKNNLVMKTYYLLCFCYVGCWPYRPGDLLQVYLGYSLLAIIIIFLACSVLLEISVTRFLLLLYSVNRNFIIYSHNIFFFFHISSKSFYFWLVMVGGQSVSWRGGACIHWTSLVF